MNLCDTCGQPLDDDNTCLTCYGKTCRGCGDPLYRDESIRSDATGTRHLRCYRRTLPRPAHMQDVAHIALTTA